MGWVDAWSAQIADAVAADPHKWATPDEFNTAIAGTRDLIVNRPQVSADLRRLRARARGAPRPGISPIDAARVPVPCTASTLLVLSADAKGIVMRPQALRPATARAAARQGRMRTRLTPGEKPCRKRMATLACVYDADPAPEAPA